TGDEGDGDGHAVADVDLLGVGERRAGCALGVGPHPDLDGAGPGAAVVAVLVELAARVAELVAGQLQAGHPFQEAGQGGVPARVGRAAGDEGLDVDQAVGVGVQPVGADDAGVLHDVGLRLPADVDGQGRVPVVPAVGMGAAPGQLADALVPAVHDAGHAQDHDQGH